MSKRKTIGLGYIPETNVSVGLVKLLFLGRYRGNLRTLLLRMVDSERKLDSLGETRGRFTEKYGYNDRAINQS